MIGIQAVSGAEVQDKSSSTTSSLNEVTEDDLIDWLVEMKKELTFVNYHELHDIIKFQWEINIHATCLAALSILRVLDHIDDCFASLKSSKEDRTKYKQLLQTWVQLGACFEVIYGALLVENHIWYTKDKSDIKILWQIVMFMIPENI